VESIGLENSEDEKADEDEDTTTSKNREEESNNNHHTIGGPIAPVIKAKDEVLSPGIIHSPGDREVTEALSTDTIPLTDTTLGMFDTSTSIGLKSMISQDSIRLADDSRHYDDGHDYDDNYGRSGYEMKEAYRNDEDRKESSNSTTGNDWKWIQNVRCLKIENRLKLINSVSTYVTQREYLVYVWDNKSLRDRRDLDKLVLHVIEKSSYWQRQIFGSWRNFQLSFCPSRWDMKKMNIVKDSRHSILTCLAPSNTDMYPREYEIRSIPTSVRRNHLGNVTAVLRRYGHVIRVLRGGRYVFDVHNSLQRREDAEFVFESRRTCCKCCRSGDTEEEEEGSSSSSSSSNRCGLCSCFMQCLAKTSCHLCRLPVSRCFVVRENKNSKIGKNSKQIRGPVVAILRRVGGDFVLRFRNRLSSFSRQDLIRKKRLIFAASFYVELMSYDVGELDIAVPSVGDGNRGVARKKD